MRRNVLQILPSIARHKLGSRSCHHSITEGLTASINTQLIIKATLINSVMSQRSLWRALVSDAAPRRGANDCMDAGGRATQEQLPRSRLVVLDVVRHSAVRRFGVATQPSVRQRPALRGLAKNSSAVLPSFERQPAFLHESLPHERSECCGYGALPSHFWLSLRRHRINQSCLNTVDNYASMTQRRQ